MTSSRCSEDSCHKAKWCQLGTQYLVLPKGLQWLLDCPVVCSRMNKFHGYPTHRCLALRPAPLLDCLTVYSAQKMLRGIPMIRCQLLLLWQLEDYAASGEEQNKHHVIPTVHYRELLSVGRSVLTCQYAEATEGNQASSVVHPAKQDRLMAPMARIGSRSKCWKANHHLGKAVLQWEACPVLDS